MFDGLIAILMEWIGLAFCWIATQLVNLAIALMQFVAALMPAIAIPNFLNATFATGIAEAIAWILPMTAISWMLATYFAFEIVFFVAMLVYRAIMDLL